jgi:thiamine-monophosphate kinase
MDWLEDAYRGLTACVARHGAAVIGGDVAEGDRVEFHVFGVGRVPRGAALRRGGARPGDFVYVTGALGGSIRGRHLDFEPRLAEGAWLRAGGWATAAMDVSDGLASDLRRLMEESGAGVDIEAARVPVAPAVAELADGRSAFEHAMCDGEDFELVFAVSPDRADALDRAWPSAFPLACTRIGRVTAETGHLCVLTADGCRLDLAPGGYEHFRM